VVGREERRRKGRKKAGKDGRRVDSDAQLEQCHRLAKASPNSTDWVNQLGTETAGVLWGPSFLRWEMESNTCIHDLAESDPR